MATLVNPSDIILQGSATRLITVSLANNLLFGGTVTGNVTGSINSLPAGDVSNAITNFNTSNDQNSSAITAPVAGSVTHTTNNDGSVNLKFTWTWSGTEADIDGFILINSARTTGGTYNIGDDATSETVFLLTASRRQHILYGVATDKFYNFGIRAYRRVATNISSNGTGIIGSSMVSTSTYQPSSNVAITIGTNTINTTTISGYQNSSINLSGSAGTISLTGGPTGSVTGVVMPGNQITSGNASTYLGANAIGEAYIGNLSANKITTGTLDASVVNVTNLNASNITSGTITGRTINSGTLNAGSFTGYNWPASPNTGGHLGPSGLLVGNYNDGTKGYLQFDTNTGNFVVGRNNGHYILFQGSTGAFTVNGDIIATGNIKQNNVSVFYETSSSAGASDLSWYIGPMPYNITGILIDYNLGPETFTSGGKGSGGSIGGPLLTALKWDNASLNTGFIPAPSAPGGSYRTLYIARSFYDPAYPIKVSATFLLR